MYNVLWIWAELCAWLARTQSPVYVEKKRHTPRSGMRRMCFRAKWSKACVFALRRLLDIYQVYIYVCTIGLAMYDTLMVASAEAFSGPPRPLDAHETTRGAPHDSNRYVAFSYSAAVSLITNLSNIDKLRTQFFCSPTIVPTLHLSCSDREKWRLLNNLLNFHIVRLIRDYRENLSWDSVIFVSIFATCGCEHSLSMLVRR